MIRNELKVCCTLCRVNGFKTSALNKGRVEQSWDQYDTEAYGFETKGTISINLNDDTYGAWTDEIHYIILKPIEDNRGKIRIQIITEEGEKPEEFKRGPYTYVTSPLGKDIEETLMAKFTDKKVIFSEEFVKSGVNAGTTPEEVQVAREELDLNIPPKENNGNPGAPR